MNTCSSKKTESLTNKQYITGWIDTKMEKIPQVSINLNKSDKWNNIKVKCGINRINYKVKPGIYAVGNPTADSIVLVSANYKLSFNTLRSKLKGINAWIIVLDTKGINVWCAAGKGTFGTKELVNRIKLTGLEEIVNHKQLIVPQLGAPGVSAHKVKKQSGFTVKYGPVRAADIPAFLKADMKASSEMRQVKFSTYDRLLLIPTEVKQGMPKLLLIIAIFFLLSGLNNNGYSIKIAGNIGIHSTLNLLFAFFAGAMLAPLMLPWLPGRTFSFKGFISGLILFIVSYLSKLTGNSLIEIVAWLLLILAISSFLTMTFTGSSTYTSLSGVKKEMRAAVPLQIIGAAIGAGLWITSRFI